MQTLVQAFKGFVIVPGSAFPISSGAPASSSSWAYEPLRSTRDGGARAWQIGFDAATEEVVTAYGTVGGKMQEARSKLEAKGKRNIQEQSVIAVNSKCNVKMTTHGYAFCFSKQQVAKQDSEASPQRSRARPPRKSEKSAELESGREESLERVPTDAPEPYGRQRPVPMLAKDFAKTKKALKFPVAIQPKLDGVRCMIDWVNSDECAKTPLSEDGDGDAPAVVVRFTSRGGHDFSHLESLLVEEAREILKHLPRDAVIDGELIVPRTEEAGGGGGSDFQATTSAARSKMLTDVARDRMKFAAFGIYLPSRADAGFQERDALLAEAFQRASKSTRRIVRVEHLLAHSMDEIVEIHDGFAARGEEGAMIYSLDGVYAPNKRTDWLLKYKTFDEFEGTVIAVVPGAGREKNAAQVVMRCDDGQVVNMHPEGPIAERERWLADPSLVVGKRMTYKCQGLTKSGKPRFPVARTIRDYE